MPIKKNVKIETLRNTFIWGPPYNAYKKNVKIDKNKVKIDPVGF